MINNIREKIPLSIRIKIGPYIGYLAYLINILLFKQKWPKIFTTEETVESLLAYNQSVIRFGDGEMSLITGINLPFQNNSKELAGRLKDILQTNKDGLLICIPRIFGRLGKLNDREYWFIIHHLFRYRKEWYRLLSPTQQYGDAYITRPYLMRRDKTECQRQFKKLFYVWEKKDIVLIEGEKSRLGVGNDMFSSVKSIQRILCPAENAFSKYEKIKDEAIKVPKDRLILVSLGPTAKVLAYDLFMLGYRVLDIGHIDMEYEMFLRKENKIVPVKNKYFNEINERNPEPCTDQKYLSEIIASIK